MISLLLDGKIKSRVKIHENILALKFDWKSILNQQIVFVKL